MSSTIFFLFLLTLTITYAFDAGFLELKSTRVLKDTTHYSITICALCRVTIDYLRSLSNIDTSYLERKFNETNGQCQSNIVKDIVSFLQANQQSGINPWQYITTIRIIASSNTKTDLKEMFKSESHFDSERFVGGSQLLLKRYQASIDSIQNADNYDQARKTFGEMLHTLQDFYSHSNYIELNLTSPNDVLGQRIFEKTEYAPTEMRTCISCTGSACQTQDNLDENILKKKILTTGYFIPKGLSLILGKKPIGKCSHGGTFDGSSTDEPIGGINKDKLDSVHGHLHYQAANMAYQGTVKILQEFRNQIGDDAFALFLTLKKNLNSLVISIDISCSRTNYVDLAKNISLNIVNQYEQLEFAPHNYILIIFTDTIAEVVVNSLNPNDLINAIENLIPCQQQNTTNGELYYHSLIEGLKQCEYGSIIYTFTDSSARDAYLKHQARALIRSKHVVIYSFMGEQMKKRSLLLLSSRIQQDLIDPLNGNDLASISGGLTYPITIEDRSVIAEFILRRLEWTRLQSIFMYKAKSTSGIFYIDSSINELHLDISSMGEINNINQIELRKPDNTIYLLTQNFIRTKHLYMWKIIQPSVGIWRLTTLNLSNIFNHDVQIQGKTSLICTSSLQKEIDLNVDSNGYTQLTTEPLIDSDLLILTTCENVQPVTVQISLIDQIGNILTNYTPYQSDQLGILTRIRVPNKSFRIQTILSLSNNEKVQRIEKQLISPTIFSIELIDQPYIVSEGETIQMNYTIRSTSKEKVTLRLQIYDILKLMGSDGIEQELTFINETSGTNTITLQEYNQEKFTTDLVIFAVKSRTCCSKACVLGLLLGLTIGIIIAAAVAIPLGLIKRPTPPFVRGETSSTPNWVGTYQIDSSCDTSTCCCFTNQILLTTTSSSLLQLNGTLSGRCVGSSNVVSYAVTMPTNFALGFTWYGQTLRVILSQDSSYLTLVDNTVGYCSGTALRTSYSKSQINNINLSLMIFMILIIIERII
ncbi:hypothetical protein I4U23_031404 [Adineta vaga]|nr:hypothetical protein I4U23_031404 [Adineta vaga]